ncbi:uncharacterized protein LOC123537566 [Mercenaria mercenaria]|uniref:uncharacterized protein LOC123537566 n=1 Tax=Mercenaria mercenaria TaxID=6596 RepID=UPI00234F4F84|nr:uncharacterized protein LOC123537566 [Mercenaria mercenaria]
MSAYDHGSKDTRKRKSADKRSFRQKHYKRASEKINTRGSRRNGGFFSSQAKNICKTPKGRRWSQPIMSKCLQLYAKSPHFYKQLRDSKLVVLPSPGVIVLYKNRVKHAVGFQDDIFRWMHCEARRLEIPEESWDGGILVNEMAIQEDIQINKHGDIIELTGF